MLKDITLGQFFPGNSLLHKTDARLKVLILVCFLTATIAAKSLAAFGLVSLLTVALVLLSKIPLKTVLKNLKPIIFILLFTGILNVFFYSGETVLFHWKFIKIYKESLIYAGLMMLRLICLVTGSFVILTYTTSPEAMTDAIESLLSPLKLLHVPVHDFAMMMTIALRFIPTLIEETDKIMSAQKARGADMESGGIVQRAKALIPILIPLFVSAFRRADELAEAMECRCYNGGKGRTRMNKMKSRFADWLFFAVMICLAVATFFLNRYGVRM